MANAISKSQIPYGVSFIQTSAGATITGEIKRYWTYKDMVTDPAPTRLASVANASRDEDYAVPEDHVGGVLYQRDFINSTWILIYTSKDLAVQTYVEWEHILNVPPWVGGISNNRVKVTQDTFAVPRTTYYSYGPFKVMLPPVDKVQLGDEIVLEQYDNYGFVLFEQDERIPLTGREIPVVDMTTNKTYYVVYTYPEFKYEISSDTGNRVVTEERPISCNSFKFICTETDSGIRYWALTTDGDNLDSVVVQLRKEASAHIAAKDPHPGYILKNEAQKYLLTNVKQATPERLGSVRLSVYEDIGKGAVGAIAVTPADLYAYLVNNYALKNHTHPQYALVEHTHPQYAVINHHHIISDVDGLQSELDNRAPLRHTHDIGDVNQLWEELAKKQDLLAENGTYIRVDGTTVNCTIPDASTTTKGITKLVAEVTDDNKDDQTVALTPAALATAMSIISNLTGSIKGEDGIFDLIDSSDSKTSGYVLLPFTFTSSNSVSGKSITYQFVLTWGNTGTVVIKKTQPYDIDLRKTIKLDRIVVPILNSRAYYTSQTQLEKDNIVVQFQDALRDKPAEYEDSAITHLRVIMNRINVGESYSARVGVHWCILGLIRNVAFWASTGFSDLKLFNGHAESDSGVIDTMVVSDNTTLNDLKGSATSDAYGNVTPESLTLVVYESNATSSNFVIPASSVVRFGRIRTPDPSATLIESWAYKRNQNDTTTAKYDFSNNVIHIIARHSGYHNAWEGYIRLYDSSLTIRGSVCKITNTHIGTRQTSSSSSMSYPSAESKTISFGGIYPSTDTTPQSGKFYLEKDESGSFKIPIGFPAGLNLYEIRNDTVLLDKTVRNNGHDVARIYVSAMYNDDEIRFFAYANAYGEEDDDAGVSIIFNMPEPVFRLS